jgi:hypothetical protein
MIRTAERPATTPAPAAPATNAPSSQTQPKTLTRRWFKVEGQLGCRWVEA